jgi:hypothetical protein
MNQSEEPGKGEQHPLKLPRVIIGAGFWGATLKKIHREKYRSKRILDIWKRSGI